MPDIFDELKKKDIFDEIAPTQQAGGDIFDRIPYIQKPPFKGRYPNLYGAFGVAQTFIPYLKYVDPEEREKFTKLSTGRQTKDLLLQNLEAVSYLAAGPILRGVGAVAKPATTLVAEKTLLRLPILKTFLPKTYKFLTKSLGKARPDIEAPISKAEVELVRKPTYPAIEPTPTTKMPLPKAKTLRIAEQEQITEAAINRAIANPDSPLVLDETTRIFKRISGAVEAGEIGPRDLPNILKRYNMTPEQLSKDIVWSGTHAGRTLNQLSQVSKAIKKAFPKDPEVERLLGKSANKPRSTWEWFADKYRWADNKRRMMMVSQVATSVRNAISQAGRYTINIFDDAIQGTMRTVGGQHPRQAYTEAFADFSAIWGRLSPSKRKTIEAILNKYPLDKAKMLSAPIHDITMGDRISRLVMTLNRGQEYFFRRMAFDAKVTALTKKAGIDKIKATPEMIQSAVKHSLELTYAAAPESVPGKAILAAYKQIPYLTTVQPYPRFWMNAFKFLWDYNPTGLLSTGKHLAQKNPELALKAFSKALTGSILLATAFAARTSKYAGERYYEWKIMDPKTGKQEVDEKGRAKYYDLRAYAPYTTYLYIAEQVLHPERIRPYDRIQALIGINRIAGTGLILIDALRNKKSETVAKMLKEFGGQWLGGFTVPFRTIKDFWAGIEKEEAQVQYTRETPISGPFISALPRSQRFLPQAPRLTREEGYVREDPVKRQLTGLTVKTKTPLEQEIDRLGIERLWPRTGDVRLDRMITQRIGKQIGEAGQILLKSSAYRTADDETRQYFIKDLISTKRIEARKILFPIRVRQELKKRKTQESKFDYMKTLVDRGKFSRMNFMAFMETHPRTFTQGQWDELLSVIFQREKAFIQAEKALQ